MFVKKRIGITVFHPRGEKKHIVYYDYVFFKKQRNIIHLTNIDNGNAKAYAQSVTVKYLTTGFLFDDENHRFFFFYFLAQNMKTYLLFHLEYRICNS